MIEEDTTFSERYYITLSDLQRTRIAIRILHDCLDSGVRGVLFELSSACDKLEKQLNELHEQLRNKE